LRVTGGLAGSGLLNQIKADITGTVALEPVCTAGELLGLAIIGACSLGKYATFAEAASALVRIEKRYEPDIKNAALYDRLFAEYKAASTESGFLQ
jgi:sugar (pentulose or hexulose) kinase